MARPHYNLPARDDIRRILVIKWSAMGDLVIASTLFEDIARAFPGREIHLNTLPQWAGLFRADTRFDRIIDIDVRHPKRSMANSLRWLRETRAGRYDLVIDLQTTDRSALLLTLLQLTRGRIAYRIGNNRRIPYNIYPTGELPSHALERSRIALRAAGIATPTPRPILHIPTQNLENTARLMREHALEPRGYALLMPGCQAAGYLKRWGAGHYAGLARLLHAEGLDKVVLIGGSDELEDCRQIAEACGPWAVNLCGRTEILDIVPLAENARYIVANDTGTAHVASASDTPMVVVCGPTDPRRVKPLGDNVLALQANLPCINCYQKHCSHHSCMGVITEAMVRDALHGAFPPANEVLVFPEHRRGASG